MGKTVYFDEFTITRAGTAVTLSFPADNYLADISGGENSFAAPTLTVDPAAAASEVTYSSSNTNVATVDASTGEITLVAAGKTTITAAISNSTTYSDASASYLLTVTDPAGIEASGTISWELSSPDNTTGVASEQLADFVKNINLSLGSALSFNGTKTLNGGKQDLKSTMIKMSGAGSETADTHKIKFTFKPNAGLTFHPTNVTFTATRCGTDGGKMEIDWIGADDGDIHLKSTAASKTSDDPARDNNATQNYTVYSLDIDREAGAATGECGLQIVLYNADTKSYAFRDIIITGTIDGVEQTVTSYVITATSADETMGTVSPESVEVDEGESVSLTATPKTGYAFVSWTRESDDATFTDNPLTVENVTAADAYTASFKKLFKVEYSAGEGDKGTVTTILNPEYVESTYTLPAANYYISKAGFTAIGWTNDEGFTIYDFGETITLTEDITLTPFFEESIISLDEISSELTVTWDFTGTPALNIEGATGYFVAQAEVGSITFDVPMFIDNTTGSAIEGVKGKTYNIGRTNAQINKGSKFTIPAEKGMTVVITSASSDITETTVAGQTPSSGSGSKVATYVYDGNEATVDIVFSDDGKYYNSIKVTYPAQPQAYSFYMSECGYATYYNDQTASIIPDGLTASVVESVSGNVINLLPITSVIPAGCGVVLEGTPNELYVFSPTKEPGIVGENLLRGSYDYAYTAGDDPEATYKFYALSVKDGKVGFYWMSENGGRFMNEPSKAYLPVKQTDSTLPANALFFDITDGLRNVVTVGENNAQPSYNLAGQRVNDSYKGVVITNGKKVVR
ncbi:MAG: Ig-like domain-containing protein [Prevotella sp.]|nr:Ig-like domain-containing protein [Prevotella sp.]